MERYTKLNFDIDLSKYADQLLLRDGDPTYNPIEVDQLCSIVPELMLLNNRMLGNGIVMFKPKTMTTFAGSFAGIHIDSAQNDTQPIDLGMNIPIENGTAMTTRWYNFSDVDVDNTDFYWKYGFVNPVKNMPYADTVKYRVDSMVLDAPYLFNSGEPHNVDGSSSTVDRSMLSIRWWDLAENRLLRWSDRQRLIDIIEN